MEPFNDFMLVILQTYDLLIYDNQVGILFVLSNSLDNPFRSYINWF